MRKISCPRRYFFFEFDTRKYVVITDCTILFLGQKFSTEKNGLQICFGPGDVRNVRINRPLSKLPQSHEEGGLATGKFTNITYRHLPSATEYLFFQASERWFVVSQSNPNIDADTKCTQAQIDFALPSLNFTLLSYHPS